MRIIIVVIIYFLFYILYALPRLEIISPEFFGVRNPAESDPLNASPHRARNNADCTTGRSIFLFWFIRVCSYVAIKDCTSVSGLAIFSLKIAEAETASL